MISCNFCVLSCRVFSCIILYIVINKKVLFNFVFFLYFACRVCVWVSGTRTNFMSCSCLGLRTQRKKVHDTTSIARSKFNVFLYKELLNIKFQILTLDLKFLLSADKSSIMISKKSVHKQRGSTQKLYPNHVAYYKSCSTSLIFRKGRPVFQTDS